MGPLLEVSTKPRTITELAAHLGVSSMTIHRAISGKPDISAKTRDRILAEVERLGWRPNIAARGLRQGRTFTLGVIVSNVSASFLPEVLQGINRTAEERGYHAFVSVHEHQPQRALRHLETLQSKGVDAVIYYPTEALTELAALNDAQQNVPVAVIMRDAHGFHGPCVLVNDREGGRIAADHLLALGHRKVGFVGYNDILFTRERREGFEQSLRLAGAELRPEWSESNLVPGDESAREAISRILKQSDRPTGLFCASDRLAARALQAAADLGLSVPGDLSLVGYNGDAWSTLLGVPLTTVIQPRQQLGMRAAQVVLGSDEPNSINRRIVLSPWLRQGSSSAPLA